MNPRSLLVGVAVALPTLGLILYLVRESPGPAVEAAGRAEPAEVAPAALPESSVSPSRAVPAPAAQTAVVLAPDGPLQEYRKSLLDLALLTASAIPKDPHVKTRSREMERVAAACLELQQPRLAFEVVEKIDNWRQGVGYADLAYYGARNGHGETVEPFLERARVHVERMDLQALAEEQGFDGEDESLETYQSWRRDRIRAKIARTLILQGQEDKAIEFEAGLESSEVGIVQLVRAKTMPREQVRDATKRLEAAAAEGNLDLVRNAMNVVIELLGRFYADAELRGALREGIDANLAKVPLLIQIEVLISAADVALDQGDASAALELAERGRRTLDTSPLAIEDELPKRARLAEVAARAGQPEQARRELADIAKRFDEARGRLTNIYWADIGIPIAETYASLGDASAALAAYRRARADGAENPNAIPRAEDLVSLCLSMARRGIEPDAELWSSIRATLAELREPW